MELFPEALSSLSTKELAVKLEAHETPSWAVRSILQAELLSSRVLDPCVGNGVLSEAALEAEYELATSDIHDWGYRNLDREINFLDVQDIAEIQPQWRDKEFSVLMNPPFSKACEFVDKAIDLGARKVLCFQRLAWRECLDRRSWFHNNPPARTWICGERASCRRFDIPLEEHKGNSPTAHAWFVWEKHHKGAEIGSAIWKRME